MRCTTTASGTSASRSFFTGDTFGLSHREHDTARGAWIMPTTPPVQFQPEALRRSIERLLTFSPQRMLLTHYGAVEDVPRWPPSSSPSSTRWSRRRARSPGARPPCRAQATRSRRFTCRRLREHGVTLPEAQIRDLLGLDFELNAQASRSGSTAPEPPETWARQRFDFTGRVVVVTGAANGIGAACARLFAESGATLALWDVDAGAAEALAAELGGGARALRCDVARRDEVEAATAATLAAFGRVDV
jgi:hypothetical protein